MTKDEALRLALEALEYHTAQTRPIHETNEAITAIKSALEAKDEPYAFEASMYSNDRVKVDPVTGNVSIGTPQRTWVGLTDEEQQQAYEQWQNDGWGVFYNAIEAKLKEKNT